MRIVTFDIETANWMSEIGSGDPALTRPARQVWAKDSWLAVRDPSGDLRRGLQKVGAFQGGRFINDGALKLLVQRKAARAARRARKENRRCR